MNVQGSMLEVYVLCEYDIINIVQIFSLGSLHIWNGNPSLSPYDNFSLYFINFDIRNKAYIFSYWLAFKFEL